MKLISMTDFVLEQRKNRNQTVAECLNSIFGYAQFLKQPLTLGMFIPTNEDGNVLEEPKHITETKFDMFEDRGLYKAYSDNLKIYQQAKERVLFEYKPQFDIGVIRHHISQKRTVEYLANFGELILTKSAIKQLGL